MTYSCHILWTHNLQLSYFMNSIYEGQYWSFKIIYSGSSKGPKTGRCAVSDNPPVVVLGLDNTSYYVDNLEVVWLELEEELQAGVDQVPGGGVEEGVGPRPGDTLAHRLHWHLCKRNSHPFHISIKKGRRVKTDSHTRIPGSIPSPLRVTRLTESINECLGTEGRLLLRPKKIYKIIYEIHFTLLYKFFF